MYQRGVKIISVAEFAIMIITPALWASREGSRRSAEQGEDDQGCLARSAIAMTFGARMSLPQLRGSDTAAADDVAMPRSFAWRAISCYLMCNRGAL